MQRHTMVFIIINDLHVSGGSSAHHQELKTAYTASGIVVVLLLSASGKKQNKLHKYPLLFIQF